VTTSGAPGRQVGLPISMNSTRSIKPGCAASASRSRLFNTLPLALLLPLLLLSAALLGPGVAPAPLLAAYDVTLPIPCMRQQEAKCSAMQQQHLAVGRLHMHAQLQAAVSSIHSYKVKYSWHIQLPRAAPTAQHHHLMTIATTITTTITSADAPLFQTALGQSATHTACTPSSRCHVRSPHRGACACHAAHALGSAAQRAAAASLGC
jgi:hypothetical protein